MKDVGGVSVGYLEVVLDCGAAGKSKCLSYLSVIHTLIFFFGNRRELYRH